MVLRRCHDFFVFVSCVLFLYLVTSFLCFTMFSSMFPFRVSPRKSVSFASPPRCRAADGLARASKSTAELGGELVQDGSWERLHYNWMVVSNMFYFHPYVGKIPNLTNIFQMG